MVQTKRKVKAPTIQPLLVFLGLQNSLKQVKICFGDICQDVSMADALNKYYC